MGPEAIELGDAALVLIGVLLAAWTAAAGWAILQARRRSDQAQANSRALTRLSRLFDESPSLPLLIAGDGRIKGSERLAGWFGLERLPQFLHGLATGPGGLPREEADRLWEAVRGTQRSAAPFRMTVHPEGGNRALTLYGERADAHLATGGAALIWVTDAGASERELARLRTEAEQARADFAALVGLIQAAPVPMWFRGPDARLRLVNSAYVSAVGADSAEAAVAAGAELVEPVEGLSARDVALQARDSGLPIERSVMVTIDGARRAFRVSDLPVGGNGIAGYAIDIEDLEQLAREYRAFRLAQRALLDQLSSGVAQFDANQNLIFLNQPFQRLFRLPATAGQEATPLKRVIDTMRGENRLPEVRDFPAWIREREDWFTANEAKDEEWVLADGTHLRVFAQQMPDGGLMMIVEDRTEQLKLASHRDTLLRTRTATFDNLFEGLAVFAPDGRLQMWNRRFAAEWNLAEEFLAGHPHVNDVCRLISSFLADHADIAKISRAIEAATLQRTQGGDRVALSDGRTLAIEGVPLPDGNGMLAVLDITDSQKAEAALMERNAALVEADAVKTRFLANMSYEFRTPLTSIAGFAELLQNGVAGELTETGKEYVAAIISSTARLSDQIESVLELTQSEAGMLPLADEKIELMPLVTDVVQDRAAQLEAAGLSLHLRGDHSAGRVIGDPPRLARAIGNVIDHAIAASRRGGQIQVDLKPRSDRACIVVTHLQSAEGASGGAARQNAGIGLPLARELIEAHGGRLEFGPSGNGITATITLP